MRTLVFIFLLLVAVGIYILKPEPPQEAVAELGSGDQYFSYQVPGSWEEKKGDWYEGKKLRLRVFGGNVDPRTRKVEEMTTALQILESSGPHNAADFLYRTHTIRFNRIQKDQKELDALWAQVEKARKMLPGTRKKKPDPTQVEAARELLENTKQGYADLDGDLQRKARRLGDVLFVGAYNFAEAPSTPMLVEGAPAIFLNALSQDRRGSVRHVGLLVFEFEGKLIGLSLHSDKPVEVSKGEALASGIRLDVDPPEAPVVEKESEKSPPWRLPRTAWVLLIVLGGVSLPAGLGAASGYGPSRGPGGERGASAGAGAFFFTGVAMAIGIGVFFVSLLSGMANAPTSGGGMMVGVALIFVLGIYGTAAVVAWLLTCSLASLGAKLGARHGRLSAALAAGFLAGIGALIIPASFGFFR